MSSYPFPRAFGLVLTCASLLGSGIASTADAAAPTRPNVLFIAVDDLRSDLGALGATHARTPALDTFAATSRIFSYHYVQVPTCGASRCALLRGRYPSEPAHLSNNAIATTHEQWGDANLPAWFQRHGYRTLSLGKITHHPGGRTGRLWAEGPEELPRSWDRAWIPDTPWGEPERIMHGYANGVARVPGKSPPWEAVDGADNAYPDAWIAEDAEATLAALQKSREPWFFAVGFFKPHLPFAAPRRWFDLHDPDKIPGPSAEAGAKPSWPSTWHASGEFRNNYAHAGRDVITDSDYAKLLRHAYAANVSYVDAQIGRLLAALDRVDPNRETIVVLWSDHGFLLGEHAIWGKHCLYEQALRSPLFIRAPGLREPGATTAATVESIDIFPTLVDLCGLPQPANLDGTSLRPFLERPRATALKPARSFWTNGQRTLRNDRWRLIAAPQADGSTQWELFDYEGDPDESRNHVGAFPDELRRLNEEIERRPRIAQGPNKGAPVTPSSTTRIQK